MSDKIRVWAAPEPGPSKGMLDRKVDAVLTEIDADKLKASLRSLSGKLEDVLSGIEMTGGYKLAQVEVGLELTAEGGVNLIGTATVGGKAAISLTFERG